MYQTVANRQRIRVSITYLEECLMRRHIPRQRPPHPVDYHVYNLRQRVQLRWIPSRSEQEVLVTVTNHVRNLGATPLQPRKQIDGSINVWSDVISSTKQSKYRGPVSHRVTFKTAKVVCCDG